MSTASSQILIITGSFAARGSTVQTLALARGLAARDYQVRIVCPDAALVGPEKRAGLKFVERPSLDWPLVRPLAWRWLERDLRAAVPDLIHVQHRRLLPLARWLAKRWSRPVVLNVHDYLAPSESLPSDGSWLQAIIAVSESVRGELLARTHLPEDRVHVIHSGIMVCAAADMGGVLNPRHAPVVGTAGPLESARGVKYFLEAAPAVLGEHPLTQFVVAGAGPEERALRQQARELGIAEHVTFVPNVSDFSTSLDAMDVYVLPSLKQGLGTIMLEAMARAIPVIATRSGGVDRVVEDGQTGLLIPPSDSQSLARQILTLLHDPLRARAIGEKAREMVQQEFPLERMVAGTVDVYQRVLADWSPRSTA